MSKLSKLSRNKRTESKKRKMNDQPGKTDRNRKRKLTKHLRTHPTDKTAKAALEPNHV